MSAERKSFPDPSMQRNRRAVYRAAKEKSDATSKGTFNTSATERSVPKTGAKQQANATASPALHFEKESARMFQSALRFDEPLNVKKSGMLARGVGALGTTALDGMRSNVKAGTDDNAGLQALGSADRSIRTGTSMIRSQREKGALRSVKKTERLRTKTLQRQADYIGKRQVSQPGGTNPISRAFQKKRIKRQYVQAAKTFQRTEQVRRKGQWTKRTVGKGVRTVKQVVRKKGAVYLAMALVAFLFIGSLFSFLFSATTIIGGSAVGGLASSPAGGKIFISPFDFDWTPTVSSRFGFRTHPVSGETDTFHTGLDLAVPEGTPIRAVQSGVVLQAVNGTDGYGRYVLIQHDNGYQTLYAHCHELLVTSGQKVLMGDVIARVGTTGMSTGNHLHIEVRRDGEFLDPYPLLATGNELNTGSPAMVDVAVSQIGNVGGKPYWTWYGFSQRIEWCAVFVSWCAAQNGYIDAGAVPKFAGCTQGSNWFKERGLWMPAGYLPLPGELIFFDWDGDGIPDHVGIVESCDGSTVYTVEGNTSDSCMRRAYGVNSKSIYGYGTPVYP